MPLEVEAPAMPAGTIKLEIADIRIPLHGQVAGAPLRSVLAAVRT